MADSIRVLFQGRRDILASRGGDAIQLRATRQYLGKIGVLVDFDPSFTCDCSCYDLVHLFNMTRPYEPKLQMANAKRQSKLVCLSTIYWNMDDLQREMATPIPLWLSAVRIVLRSVRWVRGLFSEQARHVYREGRLMSSLEVVKAYQQAIIEGVDVLLPNSKTELDLLQRDFPIAQDKPSIVIHNCIDGEVFHDPSSVKRDWGSAHGLGEFIMCAGRIEPRKNQLRLLEAMSQTSIPVVLVGSPGASRAYAAQVRRHMKPQDLILSEVDQEELCQIYAAARVHVLPSLYETPGLSSLEAGAMGCNLVMSDIGSQREYFGDYVEYCDAYSVEDIKSAVEQAWVRPWPNLELAFYIRANYVWEVAAQETLGVYERLLGC